MTGFQQAALAPFFIRRHTECFKLIGPKRTASVEARQMASVFGRRRSSYQVTLVHGGLLTYYYQGRQNVFVCQTVVC